MDIKRVRQLTDGRARRLAVLSSSNPAAAGMNQDLVGIYNALGRPGDAKRAAQNVPPSLRGEAVGRVLFGEANLDKPGAKEALRAHLTTLFSKLETIPPAPLWAASLILVGRVDALRSAVETAKRDGYVLYNGGRFRWMLFAAEARLVLAEGNIEEAVPLFQLAAENGGPSPAQDAGTPLLLANAWIARGDRRRAVAILEDATRGRWASSAAGAVFAGVGVRVNAWVGAASRLSELYREEGRLSEANLLDRDLAKLLVEAEPDFPLLVQLQARQNPQ